MDDAIKVKGVQSVQDQKHINILNMWLTKQLAVVHYKRKESRGATRGIKI